jgi:hypothetical protein
MEAFIEEFQQTIEGAAEELLKLSETESEIRPAPGQWAAKEIIGHLIDSAANNHRRFVEAQWRDDLDFPGYEQERWVAVQRYGERPWAELIGLWKAYNLHLAHVVSFIPEETLKRPRNRHSLDQIAWQRVGRGNMVSLEYLIRDYLGHLREHLDQIRMRPNTSL